MLKTFRLLRVDQQKLNILRASVSTETNGKWDLFTSVCLERKPVVSPRLNAIETEFQKYLSMVELERSMKSDHELRHENDLKKAEMLRERGGETDLDAVQLQTAQDFKDTCTEELKKFQFESRTTDADKKNDLKSLERKLDRYLVLLTQQQIGKKKYFLPPQAVRQEGESLRQTAERTLKETCGNELKVQFYGNAPVGFYKYKYPKDSKNNGTVGAKVFIYFARYLNGQVTDKTQFKWMDRTELSNEVPKDYHKSLSKFLIDETWTEEEKISKSELSTMEKTSKSVHMMEKTSKPDKTTKSELSMTEKTSKLENTTKSGFSTIEKTSKPEKTTKPKFSTMEKTSKLELDTKEKTSKPEEIRTVEKSMKSEIRNPENVTKFEKTSKPVNNQ